MLCLCLHHHSSFRQKQLTGKIAGMVMPAGHSIIMKTMRVKEIMFAALLGVIMHNEQLDNLFMNAVMKLYGIVDIVSKTKLFCDQELFAYERYSNFHQSFTLGTYFQGSHGPVSDLIPPSMMKKRLKIEFGYHVQDCFSCPIDKGGYNNM